MKKLIDLFNIPYSLNMGLSGMTDESFCLYTYGMFQKNNKGILIITSTLTEANNLLNILSSLTDDVLLFPMDDFLTSESLSISPDLMATRLETINEIINNSKKIVITNLTGYLRYLPSKKVYKENIITLKQGDSISPQELVKKLYNIGYKN